MLLSRVRLDGTAPITTNVTHICDEVLGKMPSPPASPRPETTISTKGLQKMGSPPAAAAPAAPAVVCLDDPTNELFWETLILETLGLFGVPWLHYQRTMSVAKLKKSVVQSASKRLKCSATGMKAQYDANFNPGKRYMADDGQVYVPSQFKVPSPAACNRRNPLAQPLRPMPMKPTPMKTSGTQAAIPAADAADPDTGLAGRCPSWSWHHAGVTDSMPSHCTHLIPRMAFVYQAFPPCMGGGKY